MVNPEEGTETGGPAVTVVVPHLRRGPGTPAAGGGGRPARRPLTRRGRRLARRDRPSGRRSRQQPFPHAGAPSRARTGWVAPTVMGSARPHRPRPDRGADGRRPLPRPGRHPAVVSAHRWGGRCRHWIPLRTRRVDSGMAVAAALPVKSGNPAYARWALGCRSPTPPVGMGFPLWSPKTARAESTCRAAGYGFQVEMRRRAVERGLVVREIPIAFHDRRHGRSKMGLALVLEAMGWSPGGV